MFERNLVDSRVLRNKRLQTPSGPEGSSGSKPFCVPQGCLAINKFLVKILQISNFGFQILNISLSIHKESFGGNELIQSEISNLQSEMRQRCRT